MLRTRFGTVALVGAVLAAACWILAPTTAEAKNKEHHKGHKVHGKVMSVNKTATGASITIEMHKHHKKGAAVANVKPQVQTETFQVGPSTVFETVSKGAKQPARLADVRQGEEVAIEGNQQGSAEKVEITAHSHREHKGKKRGAVALN